MEENIEKRSYTELINGDIPPWVMRFIKGAGKAINRYNMIKEGDEVLLAVSGGKYTPGSFTPGTKPQLTKMSYVKSIVITKEAPTFNGTEETINGTFEGTPATIESTYTPDGTIEST